MNYSNDCPKITLLAVEEVLYLHEVAIRDFGGLDGISLDISLESCLKRVENYLEYKIIHQEDIFEIAALYAEVIARGHAFLDGNKRTAFSSMAYFLYRNSYRVKIFYENMINIFVDLADKKIDYYILSQELKQQYNYAKNLSKSIFS